MTTRKKIGRLLIVTLLAAANVALIPTERAQAGTESLDYACDQYQVGMCRCTDEFPLNECQLTGGPQACHDLYPQVCRNTEY